jgi:CAAX protease family protein
MTEQQPPRPPEPAFWPPAPPAGYPAHQGYVRPALPTFHHAQPTPYHQMLRTWTYDWWRPVVGILVTVLAFFVVTAVVYIVVAAVWAAFESGAWVDSFLDSADFDNVGPETLLGLNLGIGSLILVTWSVMRVVHRMRPRWLTSVVPKMRWRLFAICFGLAAVALLAQILVGALLPSSEGDDLGGRLNDFTMATAASALVVLLTTPLQAAGEEYLFRGYLLQAFGSLFPTRRAELARWVAIAATAVLFAFAHGAQNFPLFFDRFAFGLIAGWLVTRTGGLEAAIALHVLNNFLAFGLALSFGDLTETLNVSEASWWNIVLTLTQSLVYASLVLVVARGMRLQTHTRPPAGEADASPSADVATA